MNLFVFFVKEFKSLLFLESKQMIDLIENIWTLQSLQGDRSVTGFWGGSPVAEVRAGCHSLRILPIHQSLSFLSLMDA